MAGAGFKTFSAGQVLGASDVNTYLMQQTVMVFASATARDAALPAPAQGMAVYQKDTKLVYIYQGSGWSPVTAQTRESGTQSATLVSGSPWSTVTGSVTFSNTFASTPTVVATPVVTSSAQATVQVYSVSASGFSFRVSLYASSTATISVNWSATL